LRRFYYLKPTIQHPFASLFTILLAVEILLFGIIVLLVESMIHQVPVVFKIYYRFAYILISLLVFSLFNFWKGTRLSHKIVGPLVQIQRVLDKAINGNYKIRIQLRSGDLLLEIEQKLNTLLEKLEKSQIKIAEKDKKSKLLFKQEIE
jgi:signal transduction histidine kinase